MPVHVSYVISVLTYTNDISGLKFLVLFVQWCWSETMCQFQREESGGRGGGGSRGA